MMRVNRPRNERKLEQRGCGKNSNQYGSAHCSYSPQRIALSLSELPTFTPIIGL